MMRQRRDAPGPLADAGPSASECQGLSPPPAPTPPTHPSRPADFKNVSIVGHYIKERTKNAQFVIISLRNNMFELADRLVGIYKVRWEGNSAWQEASLGPSHQLAGGECTWWACCISRCASLQALVTC